MRSYRFFLLSGICSLSFLTFFNCSNKTDLAAGGKYLSLSRKIAQSPASDLQTVDYKKYASLKKPPLHPEEALGKFKLEEGFRIEIVAHEPMVVDPIAMDIDADGRLWVIDMPTYMRVHDKGALETSALERAPEARVVILEDTNGDGRMDVQRVFYDGLILPRAIKVLRDGILVGEPPNVVFISDTTGDGKGDKKEIVYDKFGDATDPNIHSFPGGLMWGTDNWLHSSNDNVESIRKIDGEWKTLPFRRLGQWGMTQDNWGRLYSANNARPLQTHFVPYGYSERHPLCHLNAGKNVSIGGDTLWPAHFVGVNRGYREGVLREDGTLIRATAASSTVIYRGDQFGDDYVGNAFSPEPGANLIKRYIIHDNPGDIEIKADYAYRGREFLTSTDERFRPVNIYNSPDGALYVIDMYRGILEHASHLTDYLRDHAVKHDLHIPTGEFGRIYRIVRNDRDINYKVPQFSKMELQEWVEYLHHKNGHLRDQAQQVLVQSSPSEVITRLEKLAGNKTVAPYTRLHALWTLEGFDRSVYDFNKLSGTAFTALDDNHPRVRAAAIRILEPAIAQNDEDVLIRLEELAEKESSEFVQLQLLGSLGESNDEKALQLMAKLLDKNAESVYFNEMALTGIYQREARMADMLRDKYKWGEKSGTGYKAFLAKLSEAQVAESKDSPVRLTDAEKELLEKGQKNFNTCMACHGTEGQGVDGVGPRLAGSKWVQGDPKALIRIVLHGFANNRGNKKDIAGVMPGHSYLSDEQLASVLTFIRQSWGNAASAIDQKEVARIRQQSQGRSGTWSPDELQKLSD
jgi:mono/diheme cytochrome c family protein/glucose/arabinose dehydrogenase